MAPRLLHGDKGPKVPILIDKRKRERGSACCRRQQTPRPSSTTVEGQAENNRDSKGVSAIVTKGGEPHARSAGARGASSNGRQGATGKKGRRAHAHRINGERKHYGVEGKIHVAICCGVSQHPSPSKCERCEVPC